jgi:hypothetical protein
VNWITRLARVLRPPVVTAITRHPAGYLAVERHGLRNVLAWGQTNTGIVGLVADRRGGLHPARGRFLPGGLHDATEVTVPVGGVPVADLEEAIGPGNPWTPDAQAAIYERLRAAAQVEWASRSLAAFVTDPTDFLKRHFQLIAEHGRAADLDDDTRAFLDSLIPRNQDMQARAESGRERRPTN